MDKKNLKINSIQAFFLSEFLKKQHKKIKPTELIILNNTKKYEPVTSKKLSEKMNFEETLILEKLESLKIMNFTKSNSPWTVTKEGDKILDLCKELLPELDNLIKNDYQIKELLSITK